jgi:hypothetical protein
MLSPLKENLLPKNQMSSNKVNNPYQGEGSSSFWVPALLALIFMSMLFFLSYFSFKQAEKQIETNVNKKFDQLAPQPVFVPKYDSITQARIDSLEVDRQIRHRDVDNLSNKQLQGVLDSLFNNQ